MRRSIPAHDIEWSDQRQVLTFGPGRWNRDSVSAHYRRPATDGQQFVVRQSLEIGTDKFEWRLFDNVRDVTIPVAPPDPSSPILWGDNGAAAAWLSDSTLQVWTASTEADSNQVVSIDGVSKLSAITATD